MTTHSQAHWRDTQIPWMFWIFDGHLVYLILGAIIVPTISLKIISLILAFIAIGILKFMEGHGLTPLRAAKAIRALAAGKNRPAWDRAHDRRSIDHTPLPFLINTQKEGNFS
ncbi:hypothetical protein [Kiloniella sp.]|uniref:hypothetical protein n=1 Tax=Kiloniella sp. TaxID=1938587 RepID=UPI003B012DF7